MKITVNQYQSLYLIASSDDEDLDKMIQSVAIVTGKTATEVEDIPMADVTNTYRQIKEYMTAATDNTKPVSFLKANGRRYQLNYKIASITSGQYTTVQYWMSDKDWIKHMDKILAAIAVPVARYGWIYLPKKKTLTDEQVAEDMLEVDFKEAYGSVVFFCKVFAASVSGFLPSLEKELMKQGKTEEEARTIQTDLMKRLDGFTMLSE